MNPPVSVRGWLWTGAAFEPAGSIPISDRGFRYGMSVFESLPVRHGAPLFLGEHLARLRQACAITGLQADEPALAAIPSLFENAGLDGFARLYVTAGDGPLTGPLAPGRVCVFIEPRDPIPGRVYHRGYDLRADPAPHLPLFGGAKTGNYWANAAAFREGVAADCNETLLFNPAGRLISASLANVFAVIGGEVLTPPPSDGARRGVIREWVAHQIPIREASLVRADLAAADEVFLTSSWLGIMPAATLDSRPLPSRSFATALRASGPF